MLLLGEVYIGCSSGNGARPTVDARDPCLVAMGLGQRFMPGIPASSSHFGDLGLV